MARRRNRDLAAPALALAGAGLLAGAAAGGILARRRRRTTVGSPDAALAVRRLLEEPWRGNLAVIDELAAPDYVGHTPAEPEPIVGRAAARANFERFIAAFPDGRLTVDEQVVAGSLVTTRWTARGTHTGELAGIAPTGRQITVSGLTLSRLDGGTVVEQWTSWDRLGLLVQLGAVAEPAHA